MNISYGLTVGNPVELEAILIPDKDKVEGYDVWIPTATESGQETASGNTLKVFCPAAEPLRL